MITVNCEQNSPEWFQARLGIPTASSFNKIVDSKGKRSKQREKYLYECAGEIVSGETKDSYSNGNMARGTEREDESRKTYEFIKSVEVVQIGFCYYDEFKAFGCSPDGLVGKDGMFETKDAAPHIHIERWEKEWSGSPHLQQVQGSLYVTERKWCDLVSYSRGFKPLILHIERDEPFIKALKIELKLFNEDLKSIIDKYSA